MAFCGLLDLIHVGSGSMPLGAPYQRGSGSMHLGAPYQRGSACNTNRPTRPVCSPSHCQTHFTNGTPDQLLGAFSDIILHFKFYFDLSYLLPCWRKCVLRRPLGPPSALSRSGLGSWIMEDGSRSVVHLHGILNLKGWSHQDSAFHSFRSHQDGPSSDGHSVSSGSSLMRVVYCISFLD